ncbi:MAG: GTP pyrophosphokinase [Bacteroidetes bacterium]|nr:GTP pyrophosphokinase [Bacteroidota bacterium]
MATGQKRKRIKKRSQGEIPAGALLPLAEFLKKCKISKEQYDNTRLDWKQLKKIFDDYQLLKIKLQEPAAAIVNILLTKDAKDCGVHSVRYRIKDPNSLIEKIIRKRIEKPKREINYNNYPEEITDLIGVRILHTFKYDWYDIHHFIISTFELNKKNKPIVYHREGDEKEFIEMCKDCGCKQEKHTKGYRSIHYIISTQLTKQKYYVEIQVRTIFEEGWSEIDHKIRYSYKGQASSPFDSELGQLNRIAGTADEAAMNIKKLEQKEQERILKKVIRKRKN